MLRKHLRQCAYRRPFIMVTVAFFVFFFSLSSLLLRMACPCPAWLVVPILSESARPSIPAPVFPFVYYVIGAARIFVAYTQTALISKGEGPPTLGHDLV